MRIKKRQFARLKDIAEAVNTNGVFGLTGIKLDKLIADIESVQKVKTIGVQTVQENPVPLNSIYAFVAGNIFDEQKKEVDDYIRKQGESMVAASTDKSTTFNGGLRDAVESVTNTNEISDFLDEALVLSNKDPKIGDVGFFWGEPLTFVYYGRLIDIITKNGVEYVTSTGTYSNFSKTPPELR